MTDARTTDREVAPLRERLWAAAVDADEAGAVAHLHATAPEAVLLPASLPTRLPTAHAALTACRSIGFPVLVGGAAFGPDGREARAVRADGWAAHARHAAGLLEAGVEKPYAAAARHQVDDLPRLAGQEYTLITRTRAALVRQVLHDLWERFPVLRSYTPEQQDRTAQDLQHIIEFLATAVYFDDPDLFARFVGRTTGILTARGVPVESLHLGLTVLAGHLYGFPRARRFLNETAPALDPFATTLSVTGTGTPA